MQPSTRLLAPGFMRRSLDEFKRFANLGMTPRPDRFREALRTPMTPFRLLDFSDPETISICKTMSDADMGGFSRATLDQVPASAFDPAHARFHGVISTDLPPNRPQIQRSGYAAWRNRDRGSTIFGKSLWDVDPYAFLALRVKLDGRKYFVNVQTESIVHTDIHQHRLYTRRPGEWETVLIKWADFVRTNHGQVVEPQSEMMTQKVRTLGIGLTDRVPGPFELCVAGIWATNRLEDGDVHKERE
ncbi:MAG: hypothetical protein Q9222_000183 [Ikaeria aurantiellina]